MPTIEDTDVIRIVAVEEEFGKAEIEVAMARIPVGGGALVAKSGPLAGSLFHLAVGQTVCGRDPQSTLFLDDISVSRSHARIEMQDNGFVIRDMESLNGTYLNGERVEEADLAAGDEIQIGRFRLLFFERRR